MNHHLKTTCIAAAFVCLTYGHSFADENCTTYINQGICAQTEDYPAGALKCSTTQTTDGDPCEPNKNSYNYSKDVDGKTIEVYSYVSCTCDNSSAGDVSCELTAAPPWC